MRCRRHHHHSGDQFRTRARAGEPGGSETALERTELQTWRCLRPVWRTGVWSVRILGGRISHRTFGARRDPRDCGHGSRRSIDSANTTIEVVLDSNETVPETGADFGSYTPGTQTNVARASAPRRSPTLLLDITCLGDRPHPFLICAENRARVSVIENVSRSLMGHGRTQVKSCDGRTCPPHHQSSSWVALPR